MGKFEDDDEPSKIKRHSDFDYNKRHAEKVFKQSKPMFENLVLYQSTPVIQPIKMKLHENDVMVSLQGPFGCDIGNYAYSIAYSQPHDDFRLELKNVLIATWNLYHSRFKRFYEVQG